MNTPLAVVGLVLFLLFFVLSWLNRRLEGGSLRRRDDRIALTGSHTIHVVEAGGLRMLIGTGPDSAPQLIAKLGETEAPAVAPQPEPAASSWNQPALAWLDRLGVVGGR